MNQYPSLIQTVAAASLSIVTSGYVIRRYSQHDDREITEQEVFNSKKCLEALHHNHLNNLQSCGITILPKILDKDEVLLWNRRMTTAMHSSSSSSSSTTNNNNNNNNIHHHRHNNINNNRGRLHCNQQSKKSLFYNEFIQLGNNKNGNKHILQSIVHSYFEQKGISNYKLTQLQFLDAPKGCQHQVWHRDNISPGLTVLISLSDINDNGPTELLPMTHEINTIGHVFDMIVQQPLQDDVLEYLDDHQKNVMIRIQQEPALLACLDEGDAILYDARILHRGRGYNKLSKNHNDKKDNDIIPFDRPTLVLRYDSVSTPPPGCGFIITNLNQYLGSFLLCTYNMKRKVYSMLQNNEK